MTFEEKQDLINHNTIMKSKYGLKAPSLPRILRKGKKPINDGHTASVLMGYRKRVHNFLNAHPENMIGHVRV